MRIYSFEISIEFTTFIVPNMTCLQEKFPYQTGHMFISWIRTLVTRKFLFYNILRSFFSLKTALNFAKKFTVAPCPRTVHMSIFVNFEKLI
jgi:hypothetical protein